MTGKRCGDCLRKNTDKCPFGTVNNNSIACNAFEPLFEQADKLPESPLCGLAEKAENMTGREYDELLKDSESALNRQVGGSHYKHYKIQPFEFFHANKIPFPQADIIKRLLRYNLPGGKGLQDLEKCKHEIDMIIELEGYK